MIRHFLAYTPAKIIPGIINFLAIYLYARIFTPTEYGSYSYTFSIVTLATAVLFSWIRLSSFRYFNIYVERIGKKEYIQYIFSLNVFLFFCFIVIFTIVDILWMKLMNSLILIAIFSGFSLIIIEQLFSLLRAELHSKEFKNYSIVQPIIKLLATLILVKIWSFGEKAIFLGILISSITIFSIYYYQLLKKEGILIKVINPLRYKELNKELLMYGTPLTFSFLFAVITSNSDRIAIKYFLGEDSVGLYSLSYELSNFIVTSIFMILNFTFIPVILKLIDRRNYKDADRKLQDYFWILVFITGPVIIFIYYFSPYIAFYVLGDKYYSEQAILIIKLMGIGTFFAGIKAYFFDFSFQFGKKTQLQLIPIISGAIINVILNLILIPIYNLEGALYSTLISYITALIISIYLSKRAYSISINKKTTIQIFIQLFIFTLMCSLIIKVEINFSNLLYNILIFVAIGLIYLLLNFKKIKKILLNGE